MTARTPFRAGEFYEADAARCRRHVEALLAEAPLPNDLPSRLYGGVVPHAGWSYSGRLAALTLKALVAAGARKTFVLLGADHWGVVRKGELYAAGAWRTPLGEAVIDEELAGAVLDQGGDCCRANEGAHGREHSIEVQVPIVQVLAPDAKILPIGVPPDLKAVDIGRAVAKAVRDRADEVAIVASTDLSHHGGSRFDAPGGRGEACEKYARANDRRMIELAESMSDSEVVPECYRNENACGAGALAAGVAACKALGAERGLCLEYTNSYVITHQKYPYEMDDTTVGYASIVFA